MLIKPYLLRIPDDVKVKYKDIYGNLRNDKTAKDIIKAIEKYITTSNSKQINYVELRQIFQIK
jgi:hypothetical protein